MASCPSLQLDVVQEWRWALFQAVHAAGAAAAPTQLSMHFEGLVFVWMRLRAAISALLSGMASTSSAGSAGADLDWPESAKLAQAASQVDGTLGLAEGLPPKPYLWKHGGRPLLPRTMELCESHSVLLTLCEATRCGVGVAERLWHGGPGIVVGVDFCCLHWG